MSRASDSRSQRRRSLDDAATAPGWRGEVERFCERAVFYLLCLMLLFAPLAIGAVRPWARDPLHLVTLLALALWGVRVAVAAKVTWIRTPLDLPIAFGTLYAVARYATSPVEWVSRQEILLVLMYAIVFFLTTQHLIRRLRLNILLWLIAIVGTGIAAYAIINDPRGLHKTWWMWNTHYEGRASGTFVCPNHFAGYMEIVIALTVGHVLWSARSAAERIFLVYGACVMFVALALSLSRGGYLSVCAMLLFVAMAVGRGVSKRWWPGLLLIGALGAMAAVAVVAFPELHARFQTLQSAAGEPSRWIMWTGALRMFLDHPWFGVGPFLFNTCYGPYRETQLRVMPEHVHNDYLQTLSDYGIAGFVLMGALVVTFFIAAWRIHRRWRQLEPPGEMRWQWPFFLGLDRASRPGWLLGGVAAVIAIMAHSLVDFNLHIPANALTLTVIMGVVMVADYSRRLSMQESAEVATLPSVAKAVELSSRARRAVVGVVALVVVCVGAVAVPNYVSYLLHEMAVAQRLAVLAESDNSSTQPLFDTTRLVSTGLDAVRATTERALRWDSRNYVLLQFLGELTLIEARRSSGDEAVRRAGQALEYYSRAAALNPFDPDLNSRSADVLEFLGRWEEAEAVRKHGVELDPLHFYTHQRLGTHYYSRGMKQQAVECYRRAVELEREDEFSQRKLAQLAKPDRVIR